MTTSREKIEKYEEKRMYPRINVDCPVTLGLSGDRVAEALIHDISTGGVQIHCDKATAEMLKSEKNTTATDFEMNFLLPLDGEQAEVSVRCRLVWMVKMEDGSYAIGMQFTKVEGNNRQKLKEFIETSMEPM